MMETTLYLAIIITSVLLMLVILLQSKGSGFSGAFGGDTSSIYRTRRGVEKLLFQLTIGVAALFVVLSILAQFLL
ncbi:preprotein translocase subunit SecG [Thermomicrobiaceae bacterium CFH 74404]|uniref:Protein-export membrane protein SecG n=1 Tax=Thermalbibacter longus TaxID=2951981 RepID=A0AA42BBZ6_9BACT|nr:preprotein translocase subunit SecG [Thermalbibacter longus]MCM8750360.1 preprotein translocase subunit SecG [Thermalbibacter longus]